MREGHQAIAVRVGQQLRDLRGNRTQQEFAKELELSQAQYSRYESGKRLPPDRILQLISERFGVGLDELLQSEAGAAPGGLDAEDESWLRAISALDDMAKAELVEFLELKQAETRQRREKISAGLKKLAERKQTGL